LNRALEEQSKADEEELKSFDETIYAGPATTRAFAIIRGRK
jgi:hypothetical protein